MNPPRASRTALGGEFARYVLVGLVVIGTDYLLFLGLFPRGLLPPALLNLVTLSCAATVGLLLHQRYTFRGARPLTLAVAARYMGIAALNYGLSTGVLLAGLAQGWPAWLAKGAAVVLATLVSYVLSRRLLGPAAG